MELNRDCCNGKFLKDVYIMQILEKVQRRATKMLKELRGYSYDERLRVIGITTLEDRYTRGDLIETYKIIDRLDIVNWYSTTGTNKLPVHGHAMSSRGHGKIRKELGNI
jgi:hypothetical protein